MKIKKIKYANNKIMKLQALKLSSNNSQINRQEHISYIQTHLNKISNILYKYVITNKKILFVGFPASFKHALKNTKHQVIPEFLSFSGIISNIESITDIIKEKKIDLIVIYNQDNKSTVIQESYEARIPTVNFSNLQKFKNKFAFQSCVSYGFVNEKARNNNFVLSFLKTILIRSKKVKAFEKNQSKKRKYLY